MTEEVREWWEATADDFQAEAGIDPGVGWVFNYDADLELLGDVEGEDVLELGCGGGQCTVAMAERGANVTGMDLSAAQLEHARELVAERGADVELVRGDVTDLSAFADGSFDVAFNAFVFQWVDDLAGCFEETHRVLRPGGRLAFTTPHPFDHVVDPETHRVEESYFETGRNVVVDESREANLVTYHDTVADYHDALVDAGFRTERLLEPGSSDPADYEAGPWGEHPPELASKVPDVLGFVARKPE
jgi:SAM-dependent methyltransferase